MSIFELSGKVVESAANLNEKKLEVAVSLLELYYDKRDQPVPLDTVLKDYNHIYDELKDLKPKEESQEILKQHKKTLMVLLSVIVLFLLIISFIVYKIGIHNVLAYFTD